MNWQLPKEATTPEGRILIAVFAAAVEDFQKLATATAPTARRRYQSAERLLTDGFCRDLGHEVGIPLERIHRHITQRRANAESKPQESPLAQESTAA